MTRIIYSAIFVLIFSVNICKAQKIEGTYRQIDRMTHTISFENGVFTEELGDDLIKKRGFGKYRLGKSKMIFNYQNYPQQDTSNYELVELGKSVHSALDISIFDSLLIPMWGMYGCRDSKNNVLNLVATDKEGKGNMNIFDNKCIGFFTIDCIGYHRIVIPMKRLMGKSVVIKAYLKPQRNYYIERGKITYQILQFTEKKLVLSKNGATIIFERIN